MRPAILFALLMTAKVAAAEAVEPSSPEGGTVIDSATELETLSMDLANADRVARGLQPLVPSPALARAARRYAARMRDRGFVGHVSPGQAGKTIGRRLAAEGVSDAIYGENVGRQASDRVDPAVLVSRLHQGMLSSTPHRANLLNPEFNTAGVGIVLGSTPPDGASPCAGRDTGRHGDWAGTTIPAVWIVQYFVARRLDLDTARTRIVPEGIEVTLAGTARALPCRTLLVRVNGRTGGDVDAVETEMRNGRFACRLLMPYLRGRCTIELCPLSPGQPPRAANALIVDTDAPPSLVLSSRLAWE